MFNCVGKEPLESERLKIKGEKLPEKIQVLEIVGRQNSRMSRGLISDRGTDSFSSV